MNVSLAHISGSLEVLLDHNWNCPRSGANFRHGTVGIPLLPADMETVKDLDSVSARSRIFELLSSLS